MLKVKDKAIRFIHEMRNDETEEVAATTVIVGVHIDAAARKARYLPSDIRERAVLMLDQQDGVDPSDFTPELELTMCSVACSSASCCHP